jgi:hypothetical protein
MNDEINNHHEKVSTPNAIRANSPSQQRVVQSPLTFSFAKLLTHQNSLLANNYHFFESE